MTNFPEGFRLTDFMPCSKHKETYPDCLVCALEQRDEVIEKQQVIIEAFLSIYHAQEEGTELFANQGQSLDGYSALYNYNQICRDIVYK